MTDMLCPFPGLERYWGKRDQIFPGYGNHAQFDAETVFSAKTWRQNESILDFIKCQIGRNPYQILDLTCGSGSFAITAAAKGCLVYSIDIDDKKIEMAKHNASLFGVSDNITFSCANSFDPHPYFRPDSLECRYNAVYMDPPWGTAGYENGREKPRSNSAFTLAHLAPDIRSGIALYMTAKIPLFISLPRGSSSETLPTWAEHACTYDNGDVVFRTYLTRFSHAFPDGSFDEDHAQQIAKVAGPGLPALQSRLKNIGCKFGE